MFGPNDIDGLGVFDNPANRAGVVTRMLGALVEADDVAKLTAYNIHKRLREQFVELAIQARNNENY